MHLNKSLNLLKPDYHGNSGYAPIFEMVTQYKGRAKEVAKRKDLLGLYNPQTDWKGRLPRMIFVSDMGDALSSKRDFEFLKSDLMPAITSDAGRKHLWLWLTKRPHHMAEFAAEIGGLPANVCAMTTLTGPDSEWAFLSMSMATAIAFLRLFCPVDRRTCLSSPVFGLFI